MSNLMYAEMGLNFLAGMAEYKVAKEQSKLERSVQRFRNTMAALSAANSKNAIASNAINTMDEAVFSRLSIQTQAMKERAAFDVEAAATGVIGRSIDVGRSALDANAARSRTALNRQMSHTMQQYKQQNQEVELQRIYGQDISPISRPSAGKMLFGFAQSAIDTWDAHNPEPRRTSAFLARNRKGT
jgi:hypothetical protein